MSINATLIIQIIVFLLLSAFTMKFVWPLVTRVLDERMQKIADGLAAAEKGKTDLEAAHKRVGEELAQARSEGQNRLAEAEKRAQVVAEEIKAQAHTEAARIVAQAKADAEQQVVKAREALRADVATLAVKGARQILQREVDASAHAALLNQLKAEL